jgi:serine/threonine-protein kinase RsbW
MPLNDRNGNSPSCRILVVENSDDFRAGLARELQGIGHRVTVAGERTDALAHEEHEPFDMLISDLVSPAPPTDSGFVRSFKLAVTTLPCKCTPLALHDLIEKILSFKIRCIDNAQNVKQVREKIDLELPSDLTLMNSVLEYLLDRVSKLGLVEIEQTNLFVALDEAFVNAVRHGNRNDPNKLLRVTAELSANEAIFTVEDEGDGFDVHEIPDPTDPDNLFKSNGRGVLLIYNIMDEVEYSDRGKKLKMVARPRPKALKIES